MHTSELASLLYQILALQQGATFSKSPLPSYITYIYMRILMEIVAKTMHTLRRSNIHLHAKISFLSVSGQLFMVYF